MIDDVVMNDEMYVMMNIPSTDFSMFHIPMMLVSTMLILTGSDSIAV